MSNNINWQEYCEYLIDNYIVPHVQDGHCCAYVFLGQKRQGPCLEGGSCTSDDCLIKALEVDQNRFREGD